MTHPYVCHDSFVILCNYLGYTFVLLLYICAYKYILYIVAMYWCNYCATVEQQCREDDTTQNMCASTPSYV